MKKESSKSANSRPDSIDALDKKAKKLLQEGEATRDAVFKNEAELKSMISKKASLEAELSNLLRQNFLREKGLLENTLQKAHKEESYLKQRISSLERITKIYDEKKARIREARTRQAFLKKQLSKLNKEVGEWG